ncbi:MAG: N-6 DNA methylase [Hyphomicrobiaceae bacterium]
MDWLALAVNAFLRDDKAYMAIMRRYGAREEPAGDGRLLVGNRRPTQKDHPADHFARALGAWMRAMQAEPADYLGQVYEEQAIANHYSGQFFTPEPLVELMAAMTMPEELSDDAIVSDPACGSGRMLVAGIRRNRFATFVGVDTDLTCVHMTALNCLVRNANTWIIHGNSLSVEAWRGYHVRRTPFGGELHRLSQEDATSILRLPFRQQEASTALSPVGDATQPLVPAPTVQEASPEAKATFEEASQQFTANKRGQGDFGF